MLTDGSLGKETESQSKRAQVSEVQVVKSSISITAAAAAAAGAAAAEDALALSQVPLFAQFVCGMLCSSGRIDILTYVDARRI